MKTKVKSVASRQATRNDVAKAARTSPTVVSWVMNGVARQNRVSDKTIRRVQRVAERLNYRADVWGKILRTRKSGIVGFVSPNLTDPNTAEFFRVLGPATRKRNLSLMVVDNPNIPKTGEPKPDKAIASSSSMGTELAFCEAFLLHVPGDALLEQVDRKGRFMQRPCCVLGRNVSQNHIAAVEVDNQVGARMAINHLLAVGAHDIGVIGDHRNLPYTRERAAGVKHALRDCKYKGRTLTSYRTLAENQYQAGVTAIRKWCDAKKLPGGIFAMGDVMAMGALCELGRRRINCPGSVCVIGFDGTMLAQYSSPPLSTIAQPFAEMVEAALDSIIATNHAKPAGTRKVIVKPSLLERESTGTGNRTVIQRA